MQKTPLTIPGHTIHQRIERLMRSKFVMLSVLAVMGITVVKLDTQLGGALHHAYGHGFGVMSEYMREETTRMPVDLGFNARLATMSGE